MMFKRPTWRRDAACPSILRSSAAVDLGVEEVDLICISGASAAKLALMMVAFITRHGLQDDAFPGLIEACTDPIETQGARNATDIFNWNVDRLTPEGKVRRPKTWIYARRLRSGNLSVTWQPAGLPENARYGQEEEDCDYRWGMHSQGFDRPMNELIFLRDVSDLEYAIADRAALDDEPLMLMELQALALAALPWKAAHELGAHVGTTIRSGWLAERRDPPAPPREAQTTGRHREPEAARRARVSQNSRDLRDAMTTGGLTWWQALKGDDDAALPE